MAPLKEVILSPAMASKLPSQFCAQNQVSMLEICSMQPLIYWQNWLVFHQVERNNVLFFDLCFEM